jgi:hypothetical protein
LHYDIFTVPGSSYNLCIGQYVKVALMQERRTSK